MNHESQTDEGRDEPTYNLKAVVRETGLKADTLRAWERRYGLPSPTRTPSGHRLYSKRDIGILKWLLARQQEGLSISRAVVLWQRLSEEGLDPIDVTGPDTPFQSSASASTPEAVPPRVSPDLSHSGQIFELRQNWISACLLYDEPKAEQVLATAFSLFDTETVCLELLLKAISEIGLGWSEGRVTAQQEHFASSLATRRLHSLHNGTPPPTKMGKIVMGCPPGEEHVFSAILLSLLLRRRGWNVLFLGANIPLENLASTVSTIQPNLVILIAQQLHTAGTLLDMGNVLLGLNTPLAYGGAIFMRSTDLQGAIPGHYLGNQFDKAASIIEQIMASPRVKAAMHSVSAEQSNNLLHFRETRGDIENQVWHGLSHLGLDKKLVDDANRCLAQSVMAALSMGKTSITKSELDDITMLLVKHCNMSPNWTRIYLETYYEATNDHSDGENQAAAAWLGQLIDSTESIPSYSHSQ